MGASQLNRARVRKDDEFYTLREDVEKGLNPFRDDIKGRNIYCPCDSEQSEFVKYLSALDCNLRFTSNDFSAPSNEGNWEWADIIITNPPFSKIRSFWDTVKRYKKEVIFIGPAASISYKQFLRDIANEELYIQSRSMSRFKRPNGDIKEVGAVWYNNIRYIVPAKKIKYRTIEPSFTWEGMPVYNKTCNLNPSYNGWQLAPISSLVSLNLRKWEVQESRYDNIIQGDGKHIFHRVAVRRKEERL